MAINYSLSLMRNPQKPNEEKKYFAKAQATGTVEINEIAEDVAYATSLTDGDVLNVIRALIKQMKKHMSNGRIVKLETLGTFQIQVRSTGAATKKEFTQANIKKTTIQFRPGTLVKELTNASAQSFTRVLTKAVSGSTAPIIDPDVPVIPGDDDDDPNG